MKRILLLVLSALLLLSAAACGKKADESASEETPEEITTELPAEDREEGTETAEESAEDTGKEGAESASKQGKNTAPTAPPASETVQKAKNAPAGENRFTFSGISLILPDGFEVSNEANAVMAYAKEGPDVGDVVNFIRGEAIDASAYSKELLDATLSQSVPGYGGMKRYETGQAAGADKVLMGYDVDRGGTVFHITQVMLFFADRSLALTYTDVSGKYAKDFEKSIESIRAE